MLAFALDSKSGVPTYLQLQLQVKHAMRIGVLGSGDQLPTAREVVESLGINPNTVLKAYRELERDGLVEVRQGQGTFVIVELLTVAPADSAKLRRRLNRWLEEASALGLDIDDVTELFNGEVAATLRREATA